jgi:hypothetical protein
LILVAVVSIVCIYFFAALHSSQPEQQIDKISDFKITKISGNGKVFFDKKEISVEDLKSVAVKALDIKQMIYTDEMYIRSDSHTSVEFYIAGTGFTILPDSYLFLHPKTKAFYFYRGEFYWDKKVKKKKLEVSINEPQNILSLSDAGRVRLGPDRIEIWNYSADLKFDYKGEIYSIKADQLLTAVEDTRFRTNRPPVISDVPPVPRNIEPADKIIVLSDPDASILRFDWRVVRGNPKYKFKLYSSELKESVLLERLLNSSNVTLDLLQFEEREFYWQVFPVDSSSQLEGTPSQLGHVKLIGSLLAKKNVQKPPELTIKSLTVNGNIVIIKGDADVNAQLYINDERIKADRDGGFIFTLSFASIGPKKIVIRLVSPLGVETVEERNVTIYAE